MQSIVPVELPQTPYNIVICTDGLDRLGSWMKSAEVRTSLGSKVLLVSNPTIFKHYGERAIAALTQAGFEVAHHLIPAGEQYKTPRSIQKVHDSALAHRLERSSTMVALGGGVIGDMTGFAAATWLRGIPVVQVPTSLLAMVDASIGGKTGVNHPQGKNLIGAFHQPSLVLIDPQVLKTLPPREFRAGMAEVIKYGVIWDADLFDQLEASQRLDQYRYVSPELLQMILERSCQAKAKVVSQDEKEAGLRAILNYGHTIGHAIESLMNYRGVNHGEAVAIGMVAAGSLALKLDLWDTTAHQRQQALIEKAGLPTRIPAGIEISGIVEALQLDKKVKAGKVRFVLPTQIGSVKVTDQVSQEILEQVLSSLMA
jgi:3-dehydroquinate synthase